jgi:succinate dehydrogenase / fumarate reductase flavoprotein subunit
VVLAAGGYSAVYDRHSSRDEENNGDSVALALDAGVSIVDMEFVQFHPTGMVVEDEDADDEDWAGRLVTEAVRGEGGRLFNSEGERFMERYSPEAMELDARDVVARAIWNEVNEGRGTENGGVHLDISHRERDFIKKQLPRMYERFAGLGIDLAEEPVEVSPTAHYSMGGCDIDFNTGETSVDRLYAVGEATGGVHGANRLGGNSLAETVAIGAIAADHIAEVYEDTEASHIDDHPAYTELRERVNTDGAYTPQRVMLHITEVMTEHGGIIRNKTSLEEGLEKLDYIKEELLPDMKVVSADTSSMEFAYDAEFMLKNAFCVLRGALRRMESRGAHYRDDHQNKDPEFTHNLVYKQEGGGEVEISERAVGDFSDSIVEAIDEGHTLDYHHLE